MNPTAPASRDAFQPPSDPAPAALGDRALPSHARIVVIGGGVIGCSVAYHLAHAGQDVVLLERDRITSGTTWHAAGLMVCFGSTSETSTELRKYTRDLYSRLEAETGQATGFRPCGFIELAADRDRLEEYRRVSAFNRYCGVDVQEIGPSEVAALFPLANVSDIEAGFYVRGDGRVDPVDVTRALAKGAKLRGAKILEGVPVQSVLQSRGSVTGVRTPHGDIRCEFVINCAGAWARQLGELSGVPIPLQAAEHYYLITDKLPGMHAGLPVIEDPASYGYYREEGGGLMIGLFEPVCAPWKVEGIPEDFSFGEITPDWDRMGPYLEKAMRRVPTSLDIGVRKFFCGPESFTPDLRPILGEAPELKNYIVYVVLLAARLFGQVLVRGGGRRDWRDRVVRPRKSPHRTPQLTVDRDVVRVHQRGDKEERLGILLVALPETGKLLDHLIREQGIAHVSGVRRVGAVRLRADPAGEAVGQERVGRRIRGDTLRQNFAALIVGGDRSPFRIQEIGVRDVPLAAVVRAIARRRQIVAERGNRIGTEPRHIRCPLGHPIGLADPM